MPNIHLTLAGPPEAAYPNGGDEAYWMGQVAGALAAGLNSRGIALCWGPPQEEGALWLALCSQAAPPEREGQLKGPALCFRAGDSAGGRVARALAKALEEAYPQPELIQAREEPSLPELEAAPCPGVAVRLLYRDNPQDEAWLARSTGAAGQALARGLAQALKGLCPHA